MMSTAYFIVLLFSFVMIVFLLSCLHYGTYRGLLGNRRVGQTVSAFCDTLTVETRAKLTDAVVTTDGYYIGNIVCNQFGPHKRKILKDVFVSTFLTECPYMDHELTWIHDWIRVKCLASQDLDQYRRAIHDRLQIANMMTGATYFYRDRMDPRRYIDYQNSTDLWTNSDITRIDPLDDSWFLGVRTNSSLVVFQNARSIAIGIAHDRPSRPIDQVLYQAKLIGRFSLTNTTAIEMKAVKTIYRIFQTLNNYTAEAATERPCCICFEAMEQASPSVVTLSCGHFDHEDCINQWFAQSLSCPECREDDISIVTR